LSFKFWLPKKFWLPEKLWLTRSPEKCESNSGEKIRIHACFGVK
jgi:hypothetical protein